MNDSILNLLYEPFKLKERKGLGNLTFKYISSDDVIDRMNKVFAGGWSTEIISQETVDDFVIVKVRISIYDTESERTYYHDGYGSSQIARFKSGAKIGNIIDIGNTYKSAVSKAIKYACTRWGVGLYLEKDMHNTDDVQGSPQVVTEPVTPVPYVTEAKPCNIPVTHVTEPTIPIYCDTEAKPCNIPVTNTVSPTSSEHRDIKKSVEPSKSTNMVPPTPTNTPIKNKEENEKKVPFPKAKFTEPNLDTKPIPNSNNVTILYSTKSNSIEGITDVQKAALQGLLTLRGLKYDKLAQEALERTDNIPDPEDLTYKEAVMIIKYGNEIFRKK